MDRVTLGSSRIEPWQLRPGDHIYAWRKNAAEIYSHHGIYESYEKIIHFTSVIPDGTCPRCGGANKCADGVVICCLDCFLGRDELRLFAYAVPLWFYAASNVSSLRPQPTCTTEAEDPPETVLRRANDLLAHGFGAYNLVLRNCMDFAFYCKTGRRYYDLVARVVAVPVSVSVSVCARCDGPNGSPPPPPPPRHRPPEPAARVVAPPPRHRSPEPAARRWLPEPGSVGLLPRTNFGLPSLLDPTPPLLGRQETMLGSAALGAAAAAALFRMAPFFI